MSSGDPFSPRPSTLPRTGGTVAASEKGIQLCCKTLKFLFPPEDPPEDPHENDHDEIDIRLLNAWYNVHYAISHSGDLMQKERLRNESEFKAYVKVPGSNRERELVKFLRSFAKQEVPWRDLSQNGTLLLHP